MLRLALGVGALPLMPGLDRLGGRAAGAAEFVSAMPIGHAACIGQQRAVAMEQQRADLAQIDELAHLVQRQVEIADIDGEMRLLLDDAEEDQFGARSGQRARHHAGNEHRFRLAPRLDQVALLQHRHEAGAAVGDQILDIGVIGASQRVAVDAGAGIEIGTGHGWGKRSFSGRPDGGTARCGAQRN